MGAWVTTHPNMAEFFTAGMGARLRFLRGYAAGAAGGAAMVARLVLACQWPSGRCRDATAEMRSAHWFAVASDHLPKSAKLSDAVTQNLARVVVTNVVVKRMAPIGHLECAIAATDRA